MIINMTKYLSIEGMFELKDRFSYSVYDGINEDLNTWKKYETNLVTNQAGMREMKVNLTDTVLSGTSNSIENMNVVIPRF